jgi:hypothetical protein
MVNENENERPLRKGWFFYVHRNYKVVNPSVIMFGFEVRYSIIGPDIIRQVIPEPGW